MRARHYVSISKHTKFIRKTILQKGRYFDDPPSRLTPKCLEQIESLKSIPFLRLRLLDPRSFRNLYLHILREMIFPRR